MSISSTNISELQTQLVTFLTFVGFNKEREPNYIKLFLNRIDQRLNLR